MSSSSLSRKSSSFSLLSYMAALRAIPFFFFSSASSSFVSFIRISWVMREPINSSKGSLLSAFSLSRSQLPPFLQLFDGREKMNWVQRKIYLYNVTFGLYMLDWWERCLFNTILVILMWYILYNGSRYALEFFKRHQLW
ncbi:Small subunit of serine palmitoyltransferase-like [Parasponia andersonii]|uniref:Small subunit of serine palmitoyltransferase-like n=1 Tax=Parasponia andersonii TaxID=3476 RepID=A0A2P5DWU1_PARAD|nr:Small subunit of serine palmitoyltransferase-like [Parasponia andersonii]